jgi:PadR family transcriptional regulator, regulatory protein PadR
MYQFYGRTNTQGVMDDNQELLKGTLDMLILKSLQLEPMHGWGIAARLEELSRDVFRLQTGTLYPALHRLLRRKWIAAEWRTTEHNRQARYYRLTPIGRRQLDTARASWQRASVAVNRILTAEL